MKREPISLALCLAMLIPAVAHAAHDVEENAPTPWKDNLLAFAPIVLFLVILLFLYNRQRNSPTAILQRRYLQMQIEHTQRVEVFLERIATALEKDRRPDA